MRKYTKTDQDQAQPLTREESERLMDELRKARLETAANELSGNYTQSLDSDSK